MKIASSCEKTVSDVIDITTLGFEIVKKEMPNLASGYIRLKVLYSGLCGSDIQKITNLFKNPTKNSTNLGVTLGHEFIGEIIECKSINLDFKKGDMVAINPLLPCNNCEYCNNGLTNLCLSGKAIGRTEDGAFSRYVDVPYNNVIKISDTCNSRKVLKFVLIDVVSVALHSINIAKNNKTDSILIIGDGPVAAMLCFILSRMNYKIDVIGKGKNREIFGEICSTYLEINDLVKYNLSEKYDCIFETVGRQQNETLTWSVDFVKRKGKIVVLGVIPENHISSLILRPLFYKEVSLMGSNSYTNKEFVSAKNFIEKEDRIVKYITHIFEFRSFDKAYETMLNKTKNVIKVVIKVN